MNGILKPYIKPSCNKRAPSWGYFCKQSSKKNQVLLLMNQGFPLHGQCQFQFKQNGWLFFSNSVFIPVRERFWLLFIQIFIYHKTCIYEQESICLAAPCWEMIWKEIFLSFDPYIFEFSFDCGGLQNRANHI